MAASFEAHGVTDFQKARDSATVAATKLIMRLVFQLKDEIMDSGEMIGTKMRCFQTSRRI